MILVVLMLLFSDGSVYQECTSGTATDHCVLPVVSTMDECKATTTEWKKTMHDKYKDNTNPNAEQFITGCIQKGAEQ